VGVCAPLGLSPRVDEECDTSVATGVMPTGGWR
jgi:hypothetical protein